MTIQESWERIQAYAASNWPAEEDFQLTLAGPASEVQIAAAEAALGLALPADVRESYRRHDGTRDSGLPHAVEVIPVGALAGWHAANRKTFAYYEGTKDTAAEMVEGPIKPVRWSERRVQVGENGGGDGLQIDLDPAEGGTVGQVIWFDHEYGPRRVLAPSWAAYLAQIAADCDAGVYYFDEDEEEPWARRDEVKEEYDPAAHPDPFEGMEDELDQMIADVEKEDGVPPGTYPRRPEPDAPSGPTDTR